MAEKKVEATEISVEERLNALYKLQTIMSEIDKFTILRGELPGEVQDLEDEIMGLQTRMQNYETEIADLKKNIVAYNEIIATSTANRARYQEQLNNVRNNHEFDHLTKEVEFESLEIEAKEKKIRECNMAIERKKEEQEKTTAIIEEKNAILTEKKEELESIIVETKQEVERLREEAKAVELYQKYLPEPLSETDVVALIAELKEALQATSPKDMGKMMKELSPKVKGRFDSKRLSQLVQEALR